MRQLFTGQQRRPTGRSRRVAQILRYHRTLDSFYDKYTHRPSPPYDTSVKPGLKKRRARQGRRLRPVEDLKAIQKSEKTKKH